MYYDVVTDRILWQFLDWYEKEYDVDLDDHFEKLMDMGLDLFIDVVNENFDMSYPNATYDVEYAWDKFLYESPRENRRTVNAIKDYLENIMPKTPDYEMMIEHIDNSMIMESDELMWDDFMIETLKSWKFTKKDMMIIKDALENGGNSYANFSEIISDFGDSEEMFSTYRNKDVIFVEVTPYGYDDEMTLVYDKKAFETLLGK